MKTNPLKPVAALLLVLAPVMLQAQKTTKVIEFDFCEFEGTKNKGFDLSDPDLKKGELFEIKINHINPYRYNIRLTINHDTFTTGQAPALLMEFMEPSLLGKIASVLTIVPGTGTAPDSAGKESLERYLENFQHNKMYVDENKLSKDFPNKIKREEIRSQLEDYIKKSNILRLKGIIADLTYEMEELYTQVGHCYDQSVQAVYQAGIDCNTQMDMSCYSPATCSCIKNEQAGAMSKLPFTRKLLLQYLDSLFAAEGIDADDLKKMTGELGAEKYSHTYLARIQSKTSFNFMLAQNTTTLSTWRSFPIQVQGDALELKIDITPKSAGSEKKEEEAEKEEEKENGNQATANNSNPVVININGEKKTETEETEKPGEDKNGITEPAVNPYSGEELKLSLPPAVFEYHLHYKYRINQYFYGFSSGFFIDGLKNEQYSNKPNDATDANTTYRLVKEASKTGQFGIMATINGGVYFNRETNWFFHLFAGPGLSVQQTLQPRLMAGIGLGSGSKNKLSLNGGITIGPVKKLSAAFDTNTDYTTPQTDLYYTTNQTSWFVSINFLFDMSQSKKEETKE